MTTTAIPRHANARPPSRLAWVAGLFRAAIALFRAVMSRLAASRLAWALGLIRLAVFLVFHPSAPLPTTGLLNVRIPDAPRDIRVGRLEEMTYGYRTTALRQFGCWVAKRSFGPVTVEAHLKDNDYTAQLAARITRERAAA